MDKQLVETLGKVVIAAAWADKKLTSAEINSLKDLLFQFQRDLTLPDVSFGHQLWTMISGMDETTSRDGSGINIPAREMAKFEMYTESPIDAPERELLVNQLREAIWTEEDKALVISALKSMVEADGNITDEEQAVLNEIMATMQSVDTGVFRRLGRLLQSSVERRSQAVENAPNREKYFEDFLKNKVFYEMRRRLDRGDQSLEIPDEALRKLGAIGGLLARVAQVDSIVLEAEREEIMSLLQTGWGLSQEAATFVIEVAMSEVSKDFDYLRMTRNLFDITTLDERTHLLDLLFAVANADRKVSAEELREIHRIAGHLLLRSNQVDEAYSRIT
jgi:uncharacterized tellurite resistance protein B-like protein